MRFVKDLSGLIIVLTTFLFGFVASSAVFTYESKLVVGGSISSLAMLLIVMSLVGAVVTGWVLLLFFKDFRWSKLDNTSTTTFEPGKAPLAIAVKYLADKHTCYLLDSRNSPRLTNPKTLGRGVFIVPKHRSKFVENEAKAIISGGKLQVKNLRSYDKKIYFDFIDSNKSVVLEIVDNQPLTINFINPTPAIKNVDSTADADELAISWVKSIKA